MMSGLTFVGVDLCFSAGKSGVSSSSSITTTSGAGGSISESWKSALIIASSAICDQSVSVGGVKC